jgi:putative DNA primase/helicase
MNLSADTVRSHARGRWLFILGNLAPEIETAVSKPGSKHIACPVHGGRDGFRLFRDADSSGGGICNTCGSKADGFSLLMWLKGWSFPDSLAAVADILGINEKFEPMVLKEKAVQNRFKPVQDDDKIRSKLREVWKRSVPLGHPMAKPARLYLGSRGLDCSIVDYPALRFHPHLMYRNEDGKTVGTYPAIIALLENEKGPVTLHRIYLTEEGKKAPVDTPKKLMTAPSNRKIAGAAIRLGKPGRVLNVAEGIESALAIFEATRMVTWSLYSSSIMPSFEIPQGVEKLVIWADLDRPSPKTGERPGTEAAIKLADAARLKGLTVEIREPAGPIPDNQKSLDPLDVFNSYGLNAFALSGHHFKKGQPYV